MRLVSSRQASSIPRTDLHSHRHREERSDAVIPSNGMNQVLAWVAILLALIIQPAFAQSPIIEVEEDVYTFTNPNNGSGPLWSYGCTVIARIGDDTYATQMETGDGVDPLCNTRWRILRRRDGVWTPIAEADQYRQREPCPIAVTGDNTLNLYVNDSQTPPGTHYQRCLPHVLRFRVDETVPTLAAVMPDWGVSTTFTDHSYRGYASDRTTESLLMVNIDAQTSKQHYALMDRHGVTKSFGAITFPIRSAYPQVALQNGAAHILAIGDIVEPNDTWREYKFEQTERKWDYVFRRLFYASAPNLAETGFKEPIEIANVDETAGYIGNQDLWIAPEGDSYILYTQRETQSAMMRDKFLPGSSLLNSLHLAVVATDGTIERRVLMKGTDGQHPGHARFHATPDGKLYVLLNVNGTNGGNKLLQIRPTLGVNRVDVQFKKPFRSFVLATERAGNTPSAYIDVFGIQGDNNTMAYGCIRLE